MKTPELLPSKDSYFRVFGPKGPIIQGFGANFDAKGTSIRTLSP